MVIGEIESLIKGYIDRLNQEEEIKTKTEKVIRNKDMTYSVLLKTDKLSNCKKDTEKEIIECALRSKLENMLVEESELTLLKIVELYEDYWGYVLADRPEYIA